MKIRQYTYFWVLLLLACIFCVSIARAESSFSWDETRAVYIYDGKKYEVKVTDYAIKDAVAYGPDIFLVLGEPGETHGEIMRVYTVEGGEVVKKWQKFMQRQGPWKVRIADIDGDGKKDAAVGVYCKSRFDPDEAKRLFVYNLYEDGPTPKWLGSRLSRPMVDFEFFDLSGDYPGDELLAVEENSDGSNRLTAYHWDNFGFVVLKTLIDNFAMESFIVDNGRVIVNSEPLNVQREEP